MYFQFSWKCLPVLISVHYQIQKLKPALNSQGMFSILLSNLTVGPESSVRLKIMQVCPMVWQMKMPMGIHHQEIPIREVPISSPGWDCSFPALPVRNMHHP